MSLSPLVWRTAVALGAAALVILLARQGLYVLMEREAFVTPPPGPQVPDAPGVPPRQTFVFDSGRRRLYAAFMPASDPRAPALLVFHGDDEEVSRWAAVQQHLHAAGIASLVLDYSGYGASTGRPSVARLRQDALAAWDRFVALMPAAGRRHAMGFSLGSAVLIDVADRLRPVPDGIVVGAGFASAREMAVATGRVPAWAAWLLPDVWNSEARLGDLTLPLLILHGRDDEVIPLRQAVRLCAAARSAPRRLVVLDGLHHDQPLAPAEAAVFWQPVIGFVRSGRLGVADGESVCSPS